MAGVSADHIPRILHLGNKADHRADLKQAIENDGYHYLYLTDVESACRLLADHPPDLMLVEQSASWWFNNAELERSRQTHGPVPLIVMGREEESDELVALALGADDYVPHGSVNRLLARIKAAIRRKRNHDGAVPVLDAGPLKLDESRYQAHVEGRAIYLTPSEFKLLHEIVVANGRVVHRDLLLTRVFGVSGQVESRRIDVHIAGLRKKLGPAADWLQTVRTLGYVWREPIASAASHVT